MKIRIHSRHRIFVDVSYTKVAVRTVLDRSGIVEYFAVQRT
jgi:hypothetical protein